MYLGIEVDDATEIVEKMTSEDCFTSTSGPGRRQATGVPK
jgi:hypothetical protein